MIHPKKERDRPMRKSSAIVFLAPTVALSIFASACSGGTAGSGSDDGCTVDDLMRSVARLSPEEREARLAEQARQEGGLTFYSAMDAEDQNQVAEAFADRYGIGEITQFSGNPESTHQRFRQEIDAGRSEVDVYENSSVFLQISGNDGVLAEYDGPSRADLVPAAAVSPYWVGNRLNIYVVGWNTDSIERNELPDDVTGFAAPRWEGHVAITSGNFDWFQAVYTWLSEERGMSEDELDRFFGALATNAVVYDRNPLVTELNALGEFDVSVHQLLHILDRQRAANPDVPLAWTTPVEPVVTRPNGNGISCTAPNPATAVLFTDWLISKQTQENVIAGALNREPTNAGATGGQLDRSAYAVVDVDVQAMADDADEWADRWASYVQRAARGEDQ